MTWANSTIISDGYKGNYWNDGGSINPAVAIDGNGTIHVVWCDSTHGVWGNDSEIMYANYTIATGWSNATVISDGYNNSYWNINVSNNPAISIDTTGTIHVVWEDDSNGKWGNDTEIMYTNYTITTGWSNATIISDGYNESYWNTGESANPAMVVDSSGTIHVVWEDLTSGQWGGDREIMYVNYTTSVGWNNVTIISDGYNNSYWNIGESADPSIAFDELVGLHVVWFDNTPGVWGGGLDYEIMYSKLEGSKGWSNATVISDGYNNSYWNTGISAYPAIAANSTGTIHVIWTDFTAGVWGTDIEIMYVNYTDTMGWSNATVISDGYNGSYWSTDTSAFPDIAIDNNGTIHAVWEEYTPGEWGSDTEIMYTNYTAGSGWFNVTVISDGYKGNYWNIGSSFRPSIAVANSGSINVHVVWYDDTPGEWGTDIEIMYTHLKPPPPQAPTLLPPTNLGAQVFLNWTYVSDATIYYIYRDTSNITSITGLIPINMTALNYTEETIPFSGTYYYVIVAANVFGNSSISNCENITLALPPQAPVLLPLANFGKQVFLNWTEVLDSIIYYIYRNTSEITSTTGLTPISGISQNYSQDTVSTSGIFYYVIVAGNAAGNSSISNCENITIPPQAPMLQPLISIGSQVLLNWTEVPDATTYYIYRNISEIQSTLGLIPLNTTISNSSVDNVTGSGIYYYVIVAGNIFGNSSISNCENITIPPEAPILISLKSTGNQVILNWTDVPDAIIYYIYRNSSEITSTTGLTPIGMTPQSQFEDTISTSRTYYYVIVASNTYGNSSISNCENISITISPVPDGGGVISWEFLSILIFTLMLILFIGIYIKRKKKRKK